MNRDLWSFLKRLRNHINVSSAERGRMLKGVNMRTYKTNETLIGEGEVCNMIMFVIKGAVCTYIRTDEKKERVLYFRFEGQPLVDYNSFAHKLPTPITAVALESTTVLWVNHQDFFDFMSAFPRYQTVLSNMLSRELTQRTEQMQLLKIEPAKNRYKTLCDTNPEIIKRVPLKYIASYLGIALETLSRIRAEK